MLNPRKAAISRNILSVVITAALISSGIAACGKSEDPQTLISDARRYEEKGDNKAAIIQLKNALQKNPDDPEARYLLGVIYNKTGDLQSAEKELRKALSLGMSRDKVIPDLGQTLLKLGQYKQVLDETEQLTQGNSSAEILTLRGEASLGLNKEKEARSLFELALKDKPDFPDALIGLAKCSLREKDVEAAMTFAEQAVARNTKNTSALLFKADLLRIQGNVDAALNAYDQVVKLNPENVPALISKAFIEIGTEKFEAARADIGAANKLAPNNLMVLYTQALLDFTQNNQAAAWDTLQQILSKAPEHMPSLLLAGAVQNALGSPLHAEQHLKRYLEKDPTNIYARKLLASVLLKNRETQRALAVLSPALKDKNLKPDPQLYALAGESYMQARNFAKATEYFDKASSIAPENATLHTALSMSKLGQGDSAHAVSELERAIKVDPKSAQASVLLIMTHVRLKEFDKAIDVAKRLESEHPDNPLVQNLKGGAYLGKKDLANARASFEKAHALQPDYFPAIANLAQLDLQEKKPDEAKKRFEAILKKDRKNSQAMTALASLALNQGQNKEATTWLERASQENPDVLQPSLVLGAHYLRSGEKQKSLTLAQKLQRANPGNPDVLNLMAQAQFANNDKAGALETYNKIASTQPESALAQFRIASLHMAMENPSAASDALKKALALKPEYPDAQLAQATLEARKGNHEQAITIARQLQKQQDKSPVGYILEGDLQMAQKKPVLAAKVYEQAFAIRKSGPSIMKLHASLTQAGKGREATPRLLQWLNEHPDDSSTRMYLAEFYLTDRQAKSAIEQYQAILRQHPKYVPALNNLATAYHQEKNPLALEYAEKAYQLAPDSPAILDTLGWILVEQGNTERGLPLLKKAVSLVPEVGEIRYHLAFGLVKSGDKPKARKELEQLLGTGKNFPAIDEARALLKQIQ
jgi:putative PEP-CTERM system TPR-repeat lipoprotein